MRTSLLKIITDTLEILNINRTMDLLEDCFGAEG
jgi:hypothetical protein